MPKIVAAAKKFGIMRSAVALAGRWDDPAELAFRSELLKAGLAGRGGLPRDDSADLWDELKFTREVAAYRGRR